MKSAALLFLVFAICFLAPRPASAYTPPVAEPGHYGGGRVTFTLTASGEIHNLQFNDKLVAHNAGNIVEHRRFTFRQRSAVFTYHGECFWNSASHCSGTINIDIPAHRYYGPHESWQAHRLHD